MGKDHQGTGIVRYNAAMKVILIGYRGSGKSTVGRLLARRLGGLFADVDEHVLARFGDKSVREIWQTYGEPAYRRVETQVTMELCQGPAMVIALGGGTLMQPQARAAVEQLGDACRVYLHAPAQELHRRIGGDPKSLANRPSLTGQGGGLEEIQAVLATRDPVYRAVADHLVEVGGHSPEAIAWEIESLVRIKKPDETKKNRSKIT